VEAVIPHDGARGDRRKMHEEAERCCELGLDTLRSELDALIERWSDVAMGSHSMGMVALLEELRGICDG
jgi:hypothetical protein